jgi:nucleolar protein 56
MPASTVQVIGAEKALFRALKTGAQPPKHGLLFQHTLVHAAPRWQRGKIARAIAAKAVIAARVDVYGEGLNETLLEKLDVRVKEIGKKYEEAPEREPRRFDSSRQDRGDFDRRSGGFSRGNRDSSRQDFDRRGDRFSRENRDSSRNENKSRVEGRSKQNKNKKRKKFGRR